MGARGKKRRRANGSVALGKGTSTRGPSFEPVYFDIGREPVPSVDPGDLAQALELYARHNTLVAAAGDIEEVEELEETLSKDVKARFITGEWEAINYRASKLNDFLKETGKIRAADPGHDAEPVEHELLAHAATCSFDYHPDDALVWPTNQ